MTETASGGVQLEFATGRPTLTAPEAINEALHSIGFGLWPLDLAAAPDDIRALLAQATLSDSEAATARDHFLLSRERLLEVIRDAGREPQVAGGGEMSTFDATNGVTYPQLYQIDADTDYTRFDHFHVNATSEGTGLDEVMQILDGGGIKVLQHLPNGGLFTVSIDCVAGERGWIVTYDGGRPHIGSFSEASPGTKVLVQAIGPPRWEVHYVDA